MIKTTAALLEEFLDYKNPHDHVRLLVKEGRLFKLKRGLYETNKNASLFAIASVLYAPSYVSFQSALSFYGLIPERVANVTSASLNAKKNKQYSNIFGNFFYQDVSEEAFHLELRWVDDPDSPYLIATKEKALCDLLAKTKTIRDQDFAAFLSDDLRLEKDSVLSLNKSVIVSLAKAYRKRNVTLLMNYLKKGD